MTSNPVCSHCAATTCNTKQKKWIYGEVDSSFIDLLLPFFAVISTTFPLHELNTAVLLPLYVSWVITEKSSLYITKKV